MLSKRIITISRQYGSGGRKIGELLAKRLGIPFYDSELIEIAAKQSGLSHHLFIQQEQRDSHKRDFGGIPTDLPPNDKAYLAQFTAIRSLAEKAPCVIVGRGAAAALYDVVPMFNVFIYADMFSRKRRAMEEYGDAEEKLEQRIATIDKKRMEYYKFYCGLNGLQMGNYHLCIDSGYMGIENVVTLIEKAYLLEIQK